MLPTPSPRLCGQWCDCSTQASRLAVSWDPHAAETSITAVSLFRLSFGDHKTTHAFTPAVCLADQHVTAHHPDCSLWRMIHSLSCVFIGFQQPCLRPCSRTETTPFLQH